MWMNSLITKISASLLKTEARRSEGSYYVKQNNSPNLNFCGLLFFLLKPNAILKGQRLLWRRSKQANWKEEEGELGKKVLLSLKVKAKGFLPAQDLVLLNYIIMCLVQKEVKAQMGNSTTSKRSKSNLYRIFDNFTLFFSRFPLL